MITIGWIAAAFVVAVTVFGLAKGWRERKTRRAVPGLKGVRIDADVRWTPAECVQACENGLAIYTRKLGLDVDISDTLVIIRGEPIAYEDVDGDGDLETIGGRAYAGITYVLAYGETLEQLERVIAHELGHRGLGRSGVPWKEHHAIMGAMGL